MKASPTTRMGWHKHYVDLFNKTNGKRGERLANWFLLLHLAFDEQLVEVPEQTRKQLADRLWNTVNYSSDHTARAFAADQLLEIKKISKVSWHVLGLPDNAKQTLMGLL